MKLKDRVTTPDGPGVIQKIVYPWYYVKLDSTGKVNLYSKGELT